MWGIDPVANAKGSNAAVTMGHCGKQAAFG